MNEMRTGRTQLNESHTRKGSEREKMVQHSGELDRERGHRGDCVVNLKVTGFTTASNKKGPINRGVSFFEVS